MAESRVRGAVVLPRPSNTNASIRNVFLRLVDAFDGARLSSGRTLTATHKIVDFAALSDSQLPCAFISLGSFTSQRFEAWTETHTLQVPVVAKVNVDMSREGQESVAVFLEDMHALCTLFRNLPIDKDGRVVPYTQATAPLYDGEQLTELTVRGGLRITGGRVQFFPGSPFAQVNFTIEIVFNADYDPNVSVPARAVQIGLDFGDIRGLGEQAIVEGDTAALTLFDDGITGPLVQTEGLVLQFPPFSSIDSGVPRTVAGDDVRLASLNVTPYTTSALVGQSVQLNAIGQLVDWSTLALNEAATWESSDSSVATVSQAGSVTGVAPGSCTVTASFMGVTSNPVTLNVGRRWNLIVWKGQSNSSGFASVATTTTVPPGTDNRKVFPGGLVMIDYSAGVATIHAATSLVSLVEATALASGEVVGETGLAACANLLSTLHATEKYIGVSVGVVGQPLSNRVKGTSIYQAGLNAVSAILALLPAGDRLRILARHEAGGESDMYNGAAYRALADQDQVDGEADLQALTQQTEPIPVIFSQPVGPTGGIHDVCQAMVDLAVSDPDRFAVIPKYQLATEDVFHITADGQRRNGCNVARAIDALCYDEVPFRGCMPLSVVRNGAIVDITYGVEVAPLRFNTTDVIEPAGTVKGFEWYDSTASATVLSATITSATTIRVVLSNVPTGADMAIRYAHTADVDRGPTTPPINKGRRGCVCDSSTATDALGNPTPNWSPDFSWPLT